MKNFITLLLIVLAAAQGYGQKKGKTDPKDLVIDSLTIVNNQMSSRLDSISRTLDSTSNALDSTSKDLSEYHMMYKVIKEKVVMRDFDPSSMAHILDSLTAERDAAFAKLSAASGAQKDTISMLKMQNGKLQASIDTMVAGSADKTPLINELRQLKELLDAKIITQEEFDKKKIKLLEKW